VGTGRVPSGDGGVDLKHPEPTATKGTGIALKKTKKNSSLVVGPAPALAVASKVAAYCRDLKDWPRSWMGSEEDVPPGEQIVACLLPFLHHLASSNLSQKGIRRHFASLCLLGGEIIRNLHDDPSLRKLSAERLVGNTIREGGGPLIHNGSQQDQRDLDAACRLLNRFLNRTTG